MKLSKSQLDYSARRINEVIKQKIAEEVASSLTPVVKPAEQTCEQLWALVFSGKVKLRKGYERKLQNNYLYLDSYEFPETKEQVAYKKAKEKYDAAHAAITKKWAAKQQEAMDKLYLAGDADAALAIINSL
jgi:hypothetical protein